MHETRRILQRLENMYHRRDTVKQFTVDSRNAGSLVDVRYKTEWVTNDVIWLMRSDNVKIRELQPTEQLNCKFQVDLTEPFDQTILDIIDD